MTLTYRLVKGSPLTKAEYDGNIHDLDDRVTANTAAIPAAARGITSTTAAGVVMTINYSDLTSDTVTMPVSPDVDRGAWAPSTAYSVGDNFYVNGTLYRVIFNHTSALTFDPGANDGLGHNYYFARLPIPALTLPAGGAVGMVPKKASGADYDFLLGYVDALELTFEPSSSSTLVSANVADALEELETRIKTETDDAANVTFHPSSASDLVSTNVADALEELETRPFSKITGAASAAQLRDATVTALGATGTVSLDPTLGDIFTITPTGNVTLDAASVPAGASIKLIVTTAGTSSYNITPNTNFKSQGALASGTVSGKTFSICFDCDGVNFVEASRTPAM